MILKKQIKKLTDGDSEEEDIIGGMQAFTEGSYAKDTIQQILLSFKGNTVPGDDETFI